MQADISQRMTFRPDQEGRLVVTRRDWISRRSACRETARRYHFGTLTPLEIYNKVWNDEENIPIHGWMYDI